MATTLAVGLCATIIAVAQPPAAATPGQRTLLDAHNAYPERGQWTDRLNRALGTGLPIAIEQDLYWHCTDRAGCTAVVAHDEDALDGAPTLATYFFDAVRPRMEQALRDNQRDAWPLIVLNLDFKQDTAPLLEAVWQLLDAHQAWLTTAPRTSTADRVEPLTVGPMLVLVGADPAQRRRFHDAVALGDRLLAFGAMSPVRIAGKNRTARARQAIRMRPDAHLPRPADNYARWANFPWSVIEQGGQAKAGPWTPIDDARLRDFARRAHALGYWLRFYTLDGFTASDDRGWTASYNFGSLDAVRLRWGAARSAGVDFIATDQYEAFATDRQSTRPISTDRSRRSATPTDRGNRHPCESDRVVVAAFEEHTQHPVAEIGNRGIGRRSFDEHACVRPRAAAITGES